MLHIPVRDCSQILAYRQSCYLAATPVTEDTDKANMEAGMSTASEPAVPSAAPESKPEAVNLPEPAAKKKLPPKRKVAMHLAYLGAGYHVSCSDLNMCLSCTVFDMAQQCWRGFLTQASLDVFSSDAALWQYK